MFNSLNEYLKYKYINYIIYNPKELHEISDITNLNYFKEYLEQKIDLNVLSLKVLNDIKTELFELRNIFDEDRSERIKIINSIIIMLNMSDSSKYVDFYLNELNKRVMYNNKSIEKADEFIRNYSSIEELISLDFDVLTSHIDKVSDEEFEDKYLKYYTGSQKMFIYYNLSVAAILIEYPKIIENETFLKRFNTIMDIIKYNMNVQDFPERIK